MIKVKFNRSNYALLPQPLSKVLKYFKLHWSVTLIFENSLLSLKNIVHSRGNLGIKWKKNYIKKENEKGNQFWFK